MSEINKKLSEALLRAGRKDDIIQDLSKAKQFLEFEIEYLQKEREVLENG